MSTTMLVLTVAAAFLAGLYARRMSAFVRKARSRMRLGICWRYQPTGRLETRDGTTSDFCRRCGHPMGYHE